MSTADLATTVQHVAIIGAGTMGAQIAARSAMAGKTVSLFDAVDGAVERARQRQLQEILPALVATGAFPGVTSARAASQIRRATSLADAVDGADLVIEAVREDIDVKRSVFRELSALTSAVLATNSSSLPSSLLMEATAEPSRLLNMHFFAPIWVRTMLEVMSCGETSAAAFPRPCSSAAT